MTTNATADDPGARARLAPPALVGRAREQATLTRVLSSQTPALVLVEGEAGVGKSRLVRGLLGDHPPLLGACPPYRESLTLGPVVDAIQYACADLTGLPLTALAGALRPMFPEWTAQLPPAPEPLGEALAARHRLFRALAQLLDSLPGNLLVIEDVHWADDTTLEFLLFLTCRPGSPVSLVVTYRPEEVPADSLLWRLPSRLPAGRAPTRIVLGPLDLAGTTSLISSMLDGEPVVPEFAVYLHQLTGGLPLAVEESMRLLHHRANLVRRDGQWDRRDASEPPVPPTIRDLVLERVQRLGRPARQVLRASAVLGEPTDESLVCEVAGLTGEPARTGMAEAGGSGLLGSDPRGRVGFRHALMGRAVYQAIPLPRRRQLHLAAGNALRRASRRPAAALLRHFREANETASWSQYAEQAADQAVASGDHTNAVLFLNDLLSTAELPPSVAGRLARKLAVAAVFRRMVVGDVVRQVAATLRRIADSDDLDPVDQAEIRNQLGRLLVQLGEREAARTELERAIPHLRHNPAEAARAMVHLGWPLAGSWPVSVHVSWLRRAAELADDSLSPVDRLSLAIGRAGALLYLGEPAGWTLAADLPGEVTASSSLEERLNIAVGHLNLGDAAMRWGRYGEAARRLAAAQELADADQYLRIRDLILVTRAHLDWFTGRWQDLLSRTTTVAAGDDVEPEVRLEAVLVSGLRQAADGAAREAEQRFGQVLDYAARHRLVHLPSEPAAALARLRLAQHRGDEALRVTEAPIQTIATKGIWIWATELAPVRTAALIATGRAAEADRLVRAFARGLRGRDAPAPRAALASCRALLAEPGDPLRAASGFARAAAAWQRLPRPYDALLASERQAGCLLAAGRIEPGLGLLSEVFDGLSALGARGDANRVAHTLRGHGVRVRRRSAGRPGYGDQLSPREAEVVRLLVTGLTDREIAESLYLSPRTVAYHLESARRKLRAPSRTALAVAAIGAGIVADPTG